MEGVWVGCLISFLEEGGFRFGVEGRGFNVCDGVLGCFFYYDFFNKVCWFLFLDFLGLEVLSLFLFVLSLVLFFYVGVFYCLLFFRFYGK